MTPDPQPEVPRRPAIVANWKLGHARAVEGLPTGTMKELLPDEDTSSGRRRHLPAVHEPGRTVHELEGSGVAVYAQNMHQAEPEPSPARCRLRC